MNVSYRQLRVFRSVAYERSFSRAGGQLGLSQPAVSSSIRELERQMGLKLLDRTTREVVLTEAGRVLSSQLDRLLDDLDQTLAEVAILANAHAGKVRVGSSPTLSASLMPDCIAACALEAPQIRFVLLDRIQEDVLHSVHAGDVDFGVVVEPASTDDLEHEVIQHDSFVLVAPHDHRLAARKSIDWKTLDGEALVLLDQSSGSRRLIDRALGAHCARCEVRLELGHPTTVFSMVERGIGISVMPTHALPLYRSDKIVIRPLRPKLERLVMLIRRRNRALSPAAQWLWTLVARVARERR